MNNLYLAIIIVLGILALPMIFVIFVMAYSGIKHLIMHFIYKFDLFNAREKWLKDHPDWDKPYGGNSMLAGFIDHCSKPKRPW